MNRAGDAFEKAVESSQRGGFDLFCGIAVALFSFYVAAQVLLAFAVGRVPL